MSPRLLTAALCACALALGACGGDDEPTVSDFGTGATSDGKPAATATPQPVPAQDDEAIRTTIGRYYVALIAGDVKTACSLMSDHAKQELESDAAEAGNAEGSCEKTAAVYTGLTEKATLQEVREVELDGDRAKAEVTFAAPTPDQDVELVRGGPDGWLIDEAD